ncbi:DegV family protein [Demequina sp. NBRC 110055]|uniref:DegV family protein n=1 Tax=Demequina sp. NBRC 110055 TaxID=1570344 RepID=UPI000A019E06|nr:DegV family protein [Demequina sp. NBRC 110055]
MTERVAVVTDSSAALPAAWVRRADITVVPLQVIVDDEARAEGVQVGADEVLAALVAGRAVSTSRPAVDAFADAFRALEARGVTGIVAVLLSSRLSGTVDAAVSAADAVGIPVEVVDSRQVALGVGFAALGAAAIAATGASVAQVAAEAARVAASASCVFTVDTLEFLRRGGRLSSAAAAVGRMLQVRPILEIVDGEVALADKVRSTARAREAVLERARAALDALDVPAVGVLGVGKGDYLDDIAARIDGAAMMVRADVGAVLAVHSGPGALAIVTADVPPSLGGLE